MKRAIDYAHLVGKAIRMERDSVADDDPDKSHGMQCVVMGVWDVTTSDGKRAVEIVADYGYGYTIREGEEEDWHFAVFDTTENLDDCGKWNRVPQTFSMSRKGNAP